MDTAGAELALSAFPLEPFHESENAAQSGGLGRDHQLSDRFGFRGHHGQAVAAAALEGVDQAVGGRVVLGTCAGGCLLAHLLCQQAPGWRQIAQACQQPRATVATLAQDGTPRRPVEFFMPSDDFIHQTHGAGLSGIELAGGEHQFHCLHAAYQADRARRATEPRENAQLHFRKADARGRNVAGNAVVAGERKFEPAAQAVTFEGGHREAAQGLEAGEYGMHFANGGGDGSGIGEVAEFADISPQHEARGLARENGQPGRQVPLGAGDDGVQLLQHLG